jgi:hypothetical protein
MYLVLSPALSNVVSRMFIPTLLAVSAKLLPRADTDSCYSGDTQASAKIRRKCENRIIPKSLKGHETFQATYRGADKSLARPTSRCILFDCENISFGASLVIYIYVYSTNIPPIMIIINRIYVYIYIFSPWRYTTHSGCVFYIGL